MVAQTHEQARRMGARRAVALCRCFAGALDFQEGRWEAADVALREAIDLYRKIGAASGEALSLQRLGVLETARGCLDEAMTSFDEGVLAAERAIMRSHCLTRLYASIARNRLAAGDIATAEQYLQQGERTVRRHGCCLTCNALLLPEAVRVALALDRFEEAEAHVRQLEETTRRFSSPGWIAMARQARGRVLAARQKWDLAYDAFREAHQAFLAVQAVYEAARCLLGQARALRVGSDTGHAEEASALEAQAAATLAALGAAGVES